MNQHHLQQSWLKQFRSRAGALEVVDIETLVSHLRPFSEIACSIDFQSEAHEEADGRIESPAIKILHGLKKGRNPVGNTDRDVLDRWVALHLTRSTRSREFLQSSAVTYDLVRAPFLNEDLALVKSFPEIWLHQVQPDDEPLVLSDNPILQIADQVIVFPFSPRVLVMFVRNDPRLITIDWRSLPQVINEASFLNATKEVYGNPDTKPPWVKIRDRARRNVLIEVRESRIRVK